MRITNNMMISTLIRNLNANMSGMDDAQRQLSSGKRISKPSDDPIGVGNALRLRSRLNETRQYLENVKEGISFLESTDSALDEVEAVLQRARELTVYGATGTLPDDSREAIAKEVEQLKEHLGQLANTLHGSNYIFGGTSSDVPPYQPGQDPYWRGNGEAINYEAGVGIEVQVNIDGQKVFTGADGSPNLFTLLDNIIANLKNGEGDQLSSNRLKELDEAINNTLELRAEVGARTNRLNLTQNRLEELEVNFTSLLSTTEDADMARVIVELKAQENVYRASLAAGARIIMPTLLDFLR